MISSDDNPLALNDPKDGPQIAPPGLQPSGPPPSEWGEALQEQINKLEATKTRYNQLYLKFLALAGCLLVCVIVFALSSSGSGNNKEVAGTLGLDSCPAWLGTHLFRNADDS